jgi:pSer/pThr/pTyr-binding forkhead associated (FHA) protein
MEFIIRDPNGNENILELSAGSYVVGSSDNANIQLFDSTVSSRHALLTVGNGRITIEDLESRNGTYLDGTRVGNVCTLNQGQRVSLGAHTLFIKSVPVAAAKVPPPHSATRPLTKSSPPTAPRNAITQG